MRPGGHKKRCSVCRALGHKRNNCPALPVHDCEERPTEAAAPQPSQPPTAPTPPATPTPPAAPTPSAHHHHHQTLQYNSPANHLMELEI